MQSCLGEIARSISHKSLNDSELHFTPRSHGAHAVRQYGVKGARELACEGYRALFEDWLPFFCGPGEAQGEIGRQKLLLRIMSTLDDTCILHRVGYDRAHRVKAEAKALLESFSIDGLSGMCDRYAAEGISPGGAADMLALTIFMDSIFS